MWTQHIQTQPNVARFSNAFENETSLLRLQTQTSAEAGQGIGLVMTAYSLEYMIKDKGYGQLLDAVKRPVAAGFFAAQSVGSRLGLCPPPLPESSEAAQRMLWGPGGYVADQLDMQQRGGVTDLIDKKRQLYSFCRLIVGGCSPRLPNVPMSLTSAIAGQKPQQPENITLNIDAYESPDVWGNIACPRTTRLFAAASFREIVFEYIDLVVFSDTLDQSEDACLDMYQNRLLRPQQQSPRSWSQFVGPIRGQSIFAESCRMLEDNGSLILMGIPKSDESLDWILHHISALPLRVDVVADGDARIVDTIVQRNLGAPWVSSTPERKTGLTPSLLVLTKVSLPSSLA